MFDEYGRDTASLLRHIGHVLSTNDDGSLHLAFVPVAHRQQAQEPESVGRGEVGQTQRHDRS